MALNCDGVDDRVNHGDIVQLNGAAAVSWSFWLKINAFLSQDALVCKGSGIGVVMSENTEVANTVGLYMPTAASRQYAIAGDLVVDQWAHWGVLYDGGGATNADKVKFLKNGLNRAITNFGVIPATFPAVGGTNLEVATDTSFFANIQVALLRIWNATLSEAQMIQEAQSFRPVRTAQLLLWSPYDDGVLARDYSGRANHGTVTGAAQIQGPPVSYGG